MNMDESKTLIKWPGGKTKEFQYIRHLIPPFDRYIEPFFGGGAVFFQLKPTVSIINDICSELIAFYRFIKGESDKKQFIKELYAYVDNWEKVPKYIKVFNDYLHQAYQNFKNGNIGEKDLKETVTLYIMSKEDDFNGLFTKDFALSPDNLLKEIIKNIISKIIRTSQIEKIKGPMPIGDLAKNIETAFRSGFYMHFRDVMNRNGSSYQITEAKKIANYYFIREFCYGSMFRYNSRGYFNIPYGGKAYNSKDFRGKVNYIFSNGIEKQFKNTTIFNIDFEKVITNHNLTTNDFMFLDPPYDTGFNEYEKNSFTKNDQIRLSNCLHNTNAKFILIIKKTPFIFELYSRNPNFHIDKFEKQYMYNVKGRNDRDVEHLIVKNYV